MLIKINFKYIYINFYKKLKIKNIKNLINNIFKNKKVYSVVLSHTEKGTYYSILEKNRFGFMKIIKYFKYQDDALNYIYNVLLKK